jgi:anaerobic magnesium-protoporphyrin IX monomethyl ester cyclase
MKVYLLNPSFIENYVRSSRCTWIPVAGSNWYPIFLAYATGYLEKNGYAVKLVDALIDGIPHEEIVKDIKDFSPNITVIYTSLDSLDNEVKLAEMIKKEINTFIVFVGPWCAMDPEGILKKSPAIDGVIRREFELPLLNLARTLEKNIDLKETKELTWQKNNQIFNNPDGEFIGEEELNKMPFVTSIYKKFLHIENYHQTSLKYPFVDMFTARGCAWGKCTFCLWPNTIHKGAKYRARTIDNVIEEIKFIERELPQAKEIFFQDDMLPMARMKELAEAIIKNNLKITWSGYAKADLDLETMKLAKKSGCRFLHIGYESGVQEILNNVNKGEIIPKMEEFTKNAKKAGISIHGDFIFGLPGETIETIKKTIKWAKKLNISDYQFVVPQPHPATPLYNWLKSKNYLSENGEPNYPNLSINDLQYWRFYAYRHIYLSPRYLLTSLLRSAKEPKELVRLVKIGAKGLPKIFRKK